MKIKLLSILLLVGYCAFGQKETMKPTASFAISGKVKASVVVDAAALKKLTSHDIGDVAITNHLGEPRSTAKGLKGVLLRDVLGLVEIDAESPKILSEYFFVCKANDGYTVVYSWNEIFNTAVGDSAYVVLEKDGKKLEQMDDSIMMISPKDTRTGRRHVKALMTIEVKRA